MASYEDDHNISSTTGPSTAPPRPRLDLEDFFSQLSSTQPGSHDEAPFRALARAFSDLPGVNTLVEELMREAGDPSVKAKGVSQEYLDSLERVPKARLKQEDVCCICKTPFLDDPYPLVVRLPCHTAHVFDLECISPWLKIHTTCPLDRKELLKKPSPAPAPAENDEEEWDENYG